MNASQLRRLAQGNRRQATKLRAAAAERIRLAETLEKLAGEIEAAAESMSLTSEHTPSTVEDVSTTLSSNALRSQAQIAGASKEHRLVVAMAKRGLSFADIAEALEAKLKPRSFPRSTVQSWVKAKSDASYRAIPQDAADALKALYSVPLSAWPRIIPGT